jgi:hypothetical protein
VTRTQAAVLESLADGKWHEQRDLVCSNEVRRRMVRAGFIRQSVARGATYGITHQTRIAITDAGRAALQEYKS